MYSHGDIRLKKSKDIPMSATKGDDKYHDLCVWMFLILLINMLEGYFSLNRTNFDLVDKLLPVSNMASSGLKKMLDFTILCMPKGVSENVYLLNFVFVTKYNIMF